MNENLKIGNYVSAEFVDQGHPDKMSDMIADWILMKFLEIDKNAKVAIEVLATNRKILIAGEYKVINEEFEKFDTEMINDNIRCWVSYVLRNLDLDPKDYDIEVKLHQQSSEINYLVTHSHDGIDLTINAGDQGIMVGYATDENDLYLPDEYFYAKKVMTIKTILSCSYPLKKDAKSLVIINKSAKNMNDYFERVVLSTQIKSGLQILEQDKIKNILKKRIAGELGIIDESKIQINFFEKGSTEADTGLTGRKIVADSYGCGFVGGGAFSGKDASKVDRSAAYFARYIAKNIVATALVSKCKVSLFYEIGNEYPSAINVDFLGIEKVKTETCSKLKKIIPKVFDFKLKSIIETLELDKADYLLASAIGHFGNNIFKWEKLDKVKEIKELFFNNNDKEEHVTWTVLS